MDTVQYTQCELSASTAKLWRFVVLCATELRLTEWQYPKTSRYCSHLQPAEQFILHHKTTCFGVVVFWTVMIMFKSFEHMQLMFLSSASPWRRMISLSIFSVMLVESRFQFKETLKPNPTKWNILPLILFSSLLATVFLLCFDSNPVEFYCLPPIYHKKFWFQRICVYLLVHFIPRISRLFHYISEIFSGNSLSNKEPITLRLYTRHPANGDPIHYIHIWKICVHPSPAFSWKYCAKIKKRFLRLYETWFLLTINIFRALYIITNWHVTRLLHPCLPQYNSVLTNISIREALFSNNGRNPVVVYLKRTLRFVRFSAGNSIECFDCCSFIQTIEHWEAFQDRWMRKFLGRILTSCFDFIAGWRCTELCWSSRFSCLVSTWCIEQLFQQTVLSLYFLCKNSVNVSRRLDRFCFTAFQLMCLYNKDFFIVRLDFFMSIVLSILNK